MCKGLDNQLLVPVFKIQLSCKITTIFRLQEMSRLHSHGSVFLPLSPPVKVDPLPGKMTRPCRSALHRVYNGCRSLADWPGAGVCSATRLCELGAVPCFPWL